MLIKNLHPRVHFRQEVLTEVTKYLRTLEQQDQDSSLKSVGRMPLFRFATDYIRTTQDNRKLMSTHTPSSTTSRSTYQQSSNGAGASTSSGSTAKAPWQQKSNVEHAASASSSGDQDEAANVAGQSQNLLGEIPRDRNLKTNPENRTKRVYPYVAVLKPSTICKSCYPDSGPATNPCVRPCYKVQCSRCQFYGHKGSMCLHSHRADGTKIE